MENNKDIVYYTSSDGTKTPIKDVEFTHLSNGLSKRYRELFESGNKDEVSKKLEEIDKIKNEIYRRINDFTETMKEK